MITTKSYSIPDINIENLNKLIIDFESHNNVFREDPVLYFNLDKNIIEITNSINSLGIYIPINNDKMTVDSYHNNITNAIEAFYEKILSDNNNTLEIIFDNVYPISFFDIDDILNCFKNNLSFNTRLYLFNKDVLIQQVIKYILTFINEENRDDILIITIGLLSDTDNRFVITDLYTVEDIFNIYINYYNIDNNVLNNVVKFESVIDINDNNYKVLYDIKKIIYDCNDDYLISKLSHQYAKLVKQFLEFSLFNKVTLSIIKYKLLKK